MMEDLLDVQNLSVHFRTREGVARAVDNVSFTVRRGETHAIVGESGSGKSVTALAVMGLLPAATARVTSGKILFKEEDLRTFPRRELRQLRGAEISMIFQEPMTALNPVLKVGDQIREAMVTHPARSGSGNMNRRQIRHRVYELMEQTGLRNPQELYGKYPHELSGGMRQRIMIAAALACRPDLIIADEPTTALDVTIQAQILELMKKLQVETEASLLLITHDLGVVAETADTLSVMYAGQIVEQGRVEHVLRDPCHPYTISLLGALPSQNTGHRGKLNAIPGTVPPATQYDSLPSPCRFYERCPYQDQRCFKKSSHPGHTSWCAREDSFAPNRE